MRPFLEKIPTEQQDALRIKKLEMDSFNYPLHFHPEFELTLIEKGSGKRFVGDDISHFQDGDLVLVGKNLPHCWLDYGNNEGLVEAMVIQFDEQSFGTHFFQVPELVTIRQLLTRAAKGIVFPHVKGEVTNQIISLQDDRGGMRIARFLIILEELARDEYSKTLSKINFELSGDHAKFDRINRVINFLYQHFKEDIELSEVAETVNMNVSAFCHYFKKCTNKSFTQYLSEIRVGYASKLLLETDKSISEICYASGYKNLSFFNRNFKSLNGQTPTKYRKEYLYTASLASDPP